MDRRLHDSLSLNWEGHVLMGYLLPQTGSITYQQAMDSLNEIRHTDYRKIEMVAEQLSGMNAIGIRRGKRNLMEAKGNAQEDISAAYLAWCTKHRMPLDLYSARMRTDNTRLFITEAIANRINGPKEIEDWLGLKRRCIETNLCDLASFGVLQKRYAKYHDGSEYSFPDGADNFLLSTLPSLSRKIYSNHSQLIDDPAESKDVFRKDSSYDNVRYRKLVKSGVLVQKENVGLADHYRTADGKRRLLTDLVEHTSNGKGRYARLLAELNLGGFFDSHKTFRARDIDMASKLGDIQAISMYLQDLCLDDRIRSSKDERIFRNHRYLSIAGWDFVSSCMEFAQERLSGIRPDETRLLVNIKGESFIPLTEEQITMIRFTAENPGWDAALIADCTGYEFYGSIMTDYYEVPGNAKEAAMKLASVGFMTEDRRLTKDGMKVLQSLLAN
jgi:hypothetical protein